LSHGRGQRSHATLSSKKRLSYMGLSNSKSLSMRPSFDRASHILAADGQKG